MKHKPINQWINESMNQWNKNQWINKSMNK